MIKSIWKLMFVSVLSLSIISCNKGSDDEVALGPGQATLQGTITLGSSSVNFAASGLNCTVNKINAGGFTSILISGASTSTPLVSLTIGLDDVTKTGTYTGSDNFIIMGGLDLTNINLDNSFNSEEKATVIVTKLTDSEIEGTFTGEIISQSGTKTGTLTKGSFKGRFN